MPKIQHITHLFNAHAIDLVDIRPDLQNVFVCPICLRRFDKNAISQELLTDGHVWPKKIRTTSQSAKGMHILLCKECNNTAGSFGDRHMQINEDVLIGEKTGKLSGKRLVQLLINPEGESIKLHAYVTRNEEDKSITLTGRLDNNLKIIDCRPEDQAKMQEIIKTRKVVGLSIQQNKELSLELARSGWITSAYLMAFFSLGYRYILNPILNPVRTLIIQSFDKSVSKQLGHQDTENFAVNEYISKYFNNPELKAIIPLDQNKLPYLQISFCEYQIKIPFWFNNSRLNYYFKSKMPDMYAQIPDLYNTGKYFISMYIKCTKTTPHECAFDFILGKPIP
jgi:hypothetical protein